MPLLHELQPGTSAQIEGFDDPRLASRLLSMGIMPGLQVNMLRKSLTGATCIIQVRAFRLAIRATEAAQIRIVS